LVQVTVNWWRVAGVVVVGVVALALYGRFAVPEAVPMTPPPPPPHAIALTPVEAEPSPGCQIHISVSKPALRPGHTAAPPAHPIPFFAERAGTLPPNGSPTVGGVDLPRGSRCAHRWATDEPVADFAALADRLAAVFPETGLWPVVWYGDPDEEGNDFNESPAAVARLDAETVVRRAAHRHRLPFRELARGAGWAGDAGFAPFATLADSWAQNPSVYAPFLVLVPANRPADVMALVGQPSSELIRNAAVSAVLRSWEERFGAVVTAAGAWQLDVVAATPPSISEDALRLATEQAAIAPESEVGSVREIADQLRSAKPHAFNTPNHWAFGWPD
jgi:uncharacterized protein DUF4253